jgi:hypothetical protein
MTRRTEFGHFSPRTPIKHTAYQAASVGAQNGQAAPSTPGELAARKACDVSIHFLVTADKTGFIGLPGVTVAIHLALNAVVSVR